MVDKIDGGLKIYYESLGIPYTDSHGIGRFKSFCEDNGFEDEDISEEIQAGANECMLIDFDEDSDGINRFPLQLSMLYEQKLLSSGFVRQQTLCNYIPKDIINLFAQWFCLVDIESIGDKTEEIFKILCHIHDTGKPPSKRLLRSNNMIKAINIKLSSNHITHQVMDKCREIYQTQTPLYIKGPLKESDIMYFMAVRFVNHNIPYFSNIIDSYNRARVISRFKGNGYILTTSTWRSRNRYLQDLARIDYTLAENLQCAVRTYCTKIAPPIQFNPLNKINDSLQIISQYIVSITQFIKRLLDRRSSKCPFQFDVCIAMDSIDVCNVSYDDDDDDVDDDNWYNRRNQMKMDIIGNVLHKLEHEQCKNHKRTIRDDLYQNKMDSGYSDNLIFVNNKKERMKEIISNIHIIDLDFIEFYNQTHPNWKIYNDTIDDVTQMDDEMATFLMEMFNEFKQIRNADMDYPKHKRFCLFIDRRNGKKDELIFYDPPSVCSNIPDDHVPEWYFESVRQCIIPRKGFGDGCNERDSFQHKPDKRSITSQSAVCGKLMTFSFHVESKDEIKCYLYWSGQTQRFLPMDVEKLLPSLFVDNCT